MLMCIMMVKKIAIMTVSEMLVKLRLLLVLMLKQIILVKKDLVHIMDV